MNTPGIPLALAGALAVAGNVAGVAFLRAVPHAYKPSGIAAWHAEACAVPGPALASALAFAIGLGAMAAFALALAAASADGTRLVSSLWIGAALIAAGALINASGSILAGAATRPVADSNSTGEAARALLYAALFADAIFNVLLGLGLIMLNLALAHAAGFPLWLSTLGVVAGVASLPVGLQAVSDVFARGIAISGPLWLAWIAIVSVRALLGPVP